MIQPVRRLLDALVPPAPHVTALVLSGGGARSSYQAGVLRYVAEVFPDVQFDILSGTSAGAINAAHLGNFQGTLGAAVEKLCDVWCSIDAERVYEAHSGRHLARALVRMTAGFTVEEPLRALVETDRLDAFLREQFGAPEGVLTGVAKNLDAGRLRALAIATTNYGTGQNVTWVQGREIEKWQRPNRVGIACALTVQHIMASTALPFFFPAVALDGAWHGDGGIRQAAPLSPAIHLGATRVLAISTRYDRSRREADVPIVTGYPSVGQIMGVLMNAVFLDVLDQDLDRFARFNTLLEKLPVWRRGGMKPIRLLAMRPSRDIGAMARDYKIQLEGALRFLVRGVNDGTDASPDWLSMILFDSGYTGQLIELGYEDARRDHARMEAFFAA